MSCAGGTPTEFPRARPLPTRRSRLPCEGSLLHSLGAAEGLNPVPGLRFESKGAVSSHDRIAHDLRGLRGRDRAHPPGTQPGADGRDHGQAEARRLQAPRDAAGGPNSRARSADRAPAGNDVSSDISAYLPRFFFGFSALPLPPFVATTNDSSGRSLRT